MTASDVSADVAVRASDSRLDLAGVVLKGKTAAISAPMQSTVILSVSQVESPHTRGLVHESIKITPESPL
jgi:hypothetical protein